MAKLKSFKDGRTGSISVIKWWNSHLRTLGVNCVGVQGNNQVALQSTSLEV